jgi:hypothetical protein
MAKVIADQLCKKGVEVTRCEEVDMAEASDEKHLEFAAQNSYILVSQDDDFAQLHSEWQNTGKLHSGIILIPKRLQGQAQVTYTMQVLLELYGLVKAGAANSNDFENDVYYGSLQLN